MPIRVQSRGARRSLGVSALAAAAVTGLIASPAAADVTFDVTIVDPDGAYTPYYASVESAVLAAANDWGSRLDGSASLQISVSFSFDVARATGRSATSSYVATVAGVDIFEQGAAAEVNSGFDPNGDEFDIEIIVNPDYMTGNLWFDPDPSAQTASVPSDRTDAISVFRHELGHAFAFNGWRDDVTGELPGNYASTFDINVFELRGLPYFGGPRAVDAYGTAVPITLGNYCHVGNEAPLPGADLIPDLMNGVVFHFGTRYQISALDLAIAADSGLRLLVNACPADLTHEGVVDGADLGLLLGNWGMPGTGDINADGAVDGADLGMLLGAWGGCR